MTVQEIVNRVRSAIDEVAVGDSQYITNSEDMQNMTKIIVDKIGYALQHIIENTPLEKLDSDMIDTLSQGELATDFSIDATTLVGKLKLPTTLLRIIEARLSSWSLSPIPESDRSPVYLMQQDQYAKGSYDRPVNIITYYSGYRYLEMYCAKESSDTLNFAYVAKPTVPAIDTTSPTSMAQDIDVPSQLDAAFIYQVAGLTMLAFREDIASSLFTIAQRYMTSDVITTVQE